MNQQVALFDPYSRLLELASETSLFGVVCYEAFNNTAGIASFSAILAVDRAEFSSSPGSDSILAKKLFFS